MYLLFYKFKKEERKVNSMKAKMYSVSKFELDGRPALKEAIPLGLQHVLAMFVGNIVPMILVAATAGLSASESNMLLQCCMIGAAISTVIQLYPLKVGGIQIGSGLPCMMGLTYVFLPACLSIAGSSGVAYIFGAQIAAGVVAISYGALLKKMTNLFPPVVTGTIVMTVGISIFNLAIGNIAGGTSSPSFGALINWGVGVFVVFVVLGFNVFGKGLPKVAAILIGMLGGYLISIPLGLVNFTGIGDVAWFAVPKPFAFGVKFNLGHFLMFLLLYFIVAVQMIGDFNVSCMGGLDREPMPEEIGGGATANGISSIISAVFNSFPTATYSQNSGIVALTKVCSRHVIGVGCVILFIAGLCPKVGAILSTIPNCVIGGGTVVVFAMIATSGMKLLAKAGFSNRNCLVIGVSLAFGLETQFCKGASAQFPSGVAAMLEENSVILTSILAIILNLVFPKEQE